MFISYVDVEQIAGGGGGDEQENIKKIYRILSQRLFEESLRLTIWVNNS